MNLPRVSLWHFLAYAALLLTVFVFFSLPHEWHEIEDAALAAGLQVIWSTWTWLLESASRAWLMAVSIALGVMCYYRYASLRRRIADVERRLRCLETEDQRVQESKLEPARLDLAPPTLPRVPSALFGPSTNGAVTHGVQDRPKTGKFRVPADQLVLFLEATRRCKQLWVKPELPDRDWLLGFTCHQGKVRHENQDYGFYFLIDGRQVLVLADGCGGTPHGQRAAYLAAKEAAHSIAKTYGKGDWYTRDPQVVAQVAIQEASLRLAKEGKRLHLVHPRDGLRTTLIVLIGDKSDVGYSYIGDGGGCVVRTSGTVEHFLTPQKASPDQLNVLAASLGPQMEGEPVVGTIPRKPGDLILAGTDGVFDRVDDSFPKDVLRAAIQFKGDLMKTAELIVAELASTQDNLGFIFDDNLSLGIMGDGTAPVLAPGFWSAPKIPQNEVTNAKLEGVSHVRSR